MTRPAQALAAALAALPLILAPAARAQSSNDELLREIQALKRGQEQLRQQIQEIQKQLQGKTKPSGPKVAGKVFDLADNPVKGASSARLTLVEFTDYQ